VQVDPQISKFVWFQLLKILTPKKHPNKNEISVNCETKHCFLVFQLTKTQWCLTSQKNPTKMQVARVVPASQLCVGAVPYPWPRLEASHGWKRGS